MHHPQDRLLNAEGGTKDRLVESARMKRAMEAMYTSILPKGFSPFVYLRWGFNVQVSSADVVLIKSFLAV
jgi:hypothetical protein